MMIINVTKATAIHNVHNVFRVQVMNGICKEEGAGGEKLNFSRCSYN